MLSSRTFTLVVLSLPLSFGTTEAENIPPSPTGLRYAGHVLLEEHPADVGQERRLAWSWGVCRMREGMLEVAGNKQGRSYAGYRLPKGLGQSLTYRESERRYTSDIPGVQRSTTWQTIYNLDLVSEEIPAGNIEVTGFCGDFTILNRFYNVGNFQWRPVWRGEQAYGFDVDPLFTAGWMVEFPPAWQARTGRYAVGSNRMGNGYSLPVLFGFDRFTEQGPTVVRKLMGQEKLARLVRDRKGQEKFVERMPDSSTSPPTLEKEGYVFQATTGATGATACGDYVYFVGYEGTGVGWYGLPKMEVKGRVFHDPLRETKGYHNENYSLVVWTYALADIAESRARRIPSSSIQPVGVNRFDTTFPLLVNMLKAGICSDGQRVYITVPVMVRGSADPYPCVLVYDAVPGKVAADDNED
jgi:hypothetical protein